MGHWLPLQQFGQVRTARGVAKITMSAVQQCRSRRPTLQHRTGQISQYRHLGKAPLSTCVRTLVAGRLTLAWREHRGPTHGNPAEISGPFKHPRAIVRWVLVAKGVNVPMIPSDQVTRCGTDQLLMWMQKSKLAHSIPCLIISWLKWAKAFLCLTSVLKRLNPPSLLFLPSFGVICCAVLLGGRFERRGASNFFGFCLVYCVAFCMLVVSLIVSCLLLCCCHRRVMRGEYRRKLQAGGRPYRVVKSWVAQALGGQKERGLLVDSEERLDLPKA